MTDTTSGEAGGDVAPETETDIEIATATEEDRSAHDPFAPPPTVPGHPMPSDRWRRAGASDEELAELATAWAAEPDDVQVALANKITESADGELRQMLDHERAAGKLTGWIDVNAPDENLPAEAPSAPQEPAESAGAPTGASGAAGTREAARAGTWTETEPVTVDGTQHKAFTLEGGWLGALVNGLRLVAKDGPALEAAIRTAVKVIEQAETKPPAQ